MISVRSPITYQKPAPSDGRRLWQLARDTECLDLNSAYFYNQFSTHFSDTSIVAIQDDRIVGFVIAYWNPQQQDSLFIWQIGVCPSAQRQGIGLALLQSLIASQANQPLTTIQATITPSNNASIRLFHSLATTRHTSLTRTPHFSRDDFPDCHEPEDLITITINPSQGVPYDTNY